ncbi:MAG: hypothetical protein J1F22_01915 [Lachnospiraceae bacterium]|nr:hypothetical protein [Lachnospiraceae bacterium]
MQNSITPALLIQYIGKGTFGLEKESLRVQPDGFLAQTANPFGDNPNIERDFCENQVEIITDVWDSAEEAWDQLKELHQQVIGILNQEGELLWPFSNPPYVRDESEIPIARYVGAKEEKTRYREYLAEKYGKKKMLYSGIHYNYTLPEELLQKMYQEQKNSSSYETYKNNVYLKLVKQVVRFDWLIVYLMAASPVMDGSFWEPEKLGQEVPPRYASYRCSEIGYWNEFVPVFDYENLDAYIESIRGYIQRGSLQNAGELYYPVRLKSRGENLPENLEVYGVTHIELRMLDINPLSPIGICIEDMKFIQMFLLYLLALEDSSGAEKEQKREIENAKRAAGYEDRDIWMETGENTSVPIRELTLRILTDMEQYFAEYSEEALQLIKYQKKKILDPAMRYAVRVHKFYGSDFVKRGIRLAKQYSKELSEEVGDHV